MRQPSSSPNLIWFYAKWVAQNALTQDLPNNGSVNVRQSKVATCMMECQSFMIKPQALQECSLQVVDMDLVND